MIYRLNRKYKEMTSYLYFPNPNPNPNLLNDQKKLASSKTISGSADNIKWN